MLALPLIGCFIAAAIAAPAPQETSPPIVGIDSYANITVYEASSEVDYARTEQLSDGSILATWTQPDTTNSSIPIYRSKDNGFSWFPLTQITSSQANRILVQPHILLINETFGDHPQGTVLVAVNAVDISSTNIEVYFSEDNGESWDLASTVATGGRANTTNGATPVWNPFLVENNKKLYAYYSDSRDTAHAQKLSHQTSTDASTWTAAINDVAEDRYTDRPGTGTVAKLPNNQWILVYEHGILNNTTQTYDFPVYYKISSDPENFGTQPAVKLNVAGGQIPSSAPYVTWSPLGGTNGTIIVSDSTHNNVFINQNLGAGVWTALNTTAGRAYSRELKIPINDNTKVRILGGAENGITTSTSDLILATVWDLKKALGLS